MASRSWCSLIIRSLMYKPGTRLLVENDGFEPRWCTVIKPSEYDQKNLINTNLYIPVNWDEGGVKGSIEVDRKVLEVLGAGFCAACDNEFIDSSIDYLCPSCRALDKRILSW